MTVDILCIDAHSAWPWHLSSTGSGRWLTAVRIFLAFATQCFFNFIFWLQGVFELIKSKGRRRKNNFFFYQNICSVWIKFLYPIELTYHRFSSSLILLNFTHPVFSPNMINKFIWRNSFWITSSKYGPLFGCKFKKLLSTNTNSNTARPCNYPDPNSKHFLFYSNCGRIELYSPILTTRSLLSRLRAKVDNRKKKPKHIIIALLPKEGAVRVRKKKSACSTQGGKE